MGKLAVMVLVLGLAGLPAAGAAEKRAAPIPVAETRYEMPPVLALIGGALVGVVLASGVVNLGAATLMAAEGAGIAEALEAGAALPLPVAGLSAVLGAVFGRDLFAAESHPPAAAPAAARPAAKPGH
jgi:hypothetical protein